MDYSDQYAYLKSKGCTFEWDEANPSWSFSKGHIMYKGSEIGTLEEDCSWISDTEGMCHQFSYKGFYANQEFKSEVDMIFLSIDSGMPLEMIKEKKREETLFTPTSKAGKRGEDKTPPPVFYALLAAILEVGRYILLSI